MALRPRRGGEHRPGILSQSFTVGVGVGQPLAPPLARAPLGHLLGNLLGNLGAILGRVLALVSVPGPVAGLALTPGLAPAGGTHKECVQPPGLAWCLARWLQKRVAKAGPVLAGGQIQGGMGGLGSPRAEIRPAHRAHHFPANTLVLAPSLPGGGVRGDTCHPGMSPFKRVVAKSESLRLSAGINCREAGSGEVRELGAR